ncbi:hypothetical protein JKF63_00826 [Porcisia hertigi]|uniref:Uncharacterized protein n=1 Tax=Porcisia hertigi TaxID=2761500 RepID=A0A836HFT3_9TRYP|nr:hypothetical protein JKF63_00826 [Porcisia hertigi]
MDCSLTDADSEQSMLGAPMSFSLPQVFNSSTPDMSVTVSLNTSSGQPSQLPQYQHKPPYSTQPSGNFHGTLLQFAPQYGTTTPSSKEVDMCTAEWSNSASSGVQPNVPVLTARCTDKTRGAMTLADLRASASNGPDSDAPHINPINSAASSVSSSALETERDEVTDLVHALVVFDKTFCVCFVPPKLRAALKVGELVLCECAHGENIGTLVANVSVLIARLIHNSRSSMASTTVEDVFFPPSDHVASTAEAPIPSAVGGQTSSSFIPTTPLNAEKVYSGLSEDQWLRRLPCVIRRGTNRDKKRVYFARLRSNDALAAAHRILRGEPLVAHAAEYQVNFACVTIYLAGERIQCPWSKFQFHQLGNTLVDPMRSDTVEFRFVSEQHHEELDLTRAITGVELSEVLYTAVAEHHKRQSGKGGTGSRAGGSHGSNSNRSSQSVQQVHQQHQVGQLSASQLEKVVAHTNSAFWTQSVTASSQAAAASAAATAEPTRACDELHDSLLFLRAPTATSSAKRTHRSPPQQHRHAHAVNPSATFLGTDALPIPRSSEPCARYVLDERFDASPDAAIRDICNGRVVLLLCDEPCTPAAAGPPAATPLGLFWRADVSAVNNTLHTISSTAADFCTSACHEPRELPSGLLPVHFSLEHHPLLVMGSRSFFAPSRLVVISIPLQSFLGDRGKMNAKHTEVMSLHHHHHRPPIYNARKAEKGVRVTPIKENRFRKSFFSQVTYTATSIQPRLTPPRLHRFAAVNITLNYSSV